MRRSVVGFLLVLTAFAIVTTAGAGNGEGERRKFNAADQASAHAVPLKPADLNNPTGWKGGWVKPDFSPPPVCPGYPMDLSSFVITGAAEKRWSRGPSTVDSEAEVFETASMVAQEWKIELGSPKAIACIRNQLDKELTAAGARLVLFKKIPFPHLAPRTSAYFLQARTPQGVTILFELVAMAKGRTEMSLWIREFSVDYIKADTSGMHTDSMNYAQTLAARAQA